MKRSTAVSYTFKSMKGIVNAIKSTSDPNLCLDYQSATIKAERGTDRYSKKL